MPNAAITPTGPIVAVLAYDGLCAFEFSIAYEVFGLPRPELGQGWYRYSLAAAEPGRLTVAGGLAVEAKAGLEGLVRADLIIIPGWRGLDAPVPEPLCEALRAAARRGARLASLCSGVFVLAAAGLLDGLKATTHWRYSRALAERHPSILIEPDVLYVDNGQILTAAGSAAGIDLCLHIVRRDFGAEAANKVARRLVVPPHRDGGQAQYIERPVPVAFEGARLSGVIDHLRATLSESHTLADLARRAGMSLRTFQRRFEETTGLPPGEWLTRERIARARELIEQGAPALDDLAFRCGFSDPSTLRRHFRRLTGVTPAAYRARFSEPQLR